MLSVLAHPSGENPHVFSDIRHNWVNSTTTVGDFAFRARRDLINPSDLRHFMIPAPLLYLPLDTSLLRINCIAQQ
jgi:hypothetical protein